jgi:hypothetical protein
MGELNLDPIDRSMMVPNWPERCRKCLAANALDPATALYCDPDIDCPYYPFGNKKEEQHVSSMGTRRQRQHSSSAWSG